ncbi:D-xylose-proton symporter [Poriferisphaera corsica]|uniref:D-xylose-proton symporter n=1 Tax=Poriferisphaera corsica TaxID=2528020 RepID=A0A517YQI6_9BACT|nr:sugar porter family MFS transporter [Poriferisphaera corsica]QDU32489.1 D-xylose-proton symporter [Poriferisphaera corsica]
MNEASNKSNHSHGEIEQGNILYVITLSCVAAVGGFLFGYDSGVINGTIPALQTAFKSTNVGTGFNVASILLGCVFGALLAGTCANRFGRKPTMIVTAVAFMLSAIGSGIANTSEFFVAARILGGLAVGAASVISPAYIAEIAPKHIRGGLGSLQQLAIVLGIFAAFLTNYLIAHSAGNAINTWLLGFAAWRWMFWMEAVPSIVFFIGAILIPESPRHLVAKGYHERAKSIFLKTRGGNVHLLVEQVKETLKTNKQPSFKDLIHDKSKRIHSIVWIGIVLSIFQQFVGINVVIYYGAYLWEAAGFTEAQALQTNLLSGAVNVSATIVAILLIDKVGRKPLLAAGSIGMFVNLAILTVIFSLADMDKDGNLMLTSNQAIVGLTVINLFVFFFGVSWGPVVWVLLGEMFPNRIRAAALSVGAAAQWLANFVITLTFPPMLAVLGLSGSYAIYTLFALISLIFVLIWIRETKGKQLEEMQL